MFSVKKPYKPVKVGYWPYVPESTDIAVADYPFKDLLVNADGVVRSDISLLKNLEAISAENPLAAARIDKMFQSTNPQDMPFTNDEDRLAYIRSRYAQDPTELADYINSLPEEIQEQLEKPADENNNPEDSDVTKESSADTTES